jgi:hypothetical protein
MTRFRSIPWVLLLCALAGSNAAGSETTGSSRDVLVFSTKPSFQRASVLVKSPYGVTYRLSLTPADDVESRPVVLVLVLQKLGSSGKGENLFWAGTTPHGYQPWFFAASDFARGAERSIYGESRIIQLRRLGMEMRVKVGNVRVTKVNVKRLLGSSSVGLEYEFENLTLIVTIKSTR